MRCIRVSASTCAVVMASLLLPGVASAQTPTVPVDRVGPCGLPSIVGQDPEKPNALPGPIDPTIALTTSYESGDWATFNTNVLAIRNAIKQWPTNDCGTVAFGPADYIIITWVGKTTLGETALLSAVVHAGTGEGYVSRLPGLSKGSPANLFHIFVSDNEQDVLAAVFLSTREENPLLNQIPDVAEKILGPMLTMLSATLGTQSLARGKSTATAKGWATMSRVDLPFERATVKVEMKAALPPQAARVRKASRDLVNTLTLMEVRYSKPAKDFTVALDAIVDSKADDCVYPKKPSDCLKVLDAGFTTAYNAACPNCSAEDLEAVRLVDSRFRALAAGLADKELSGATELRNVPLTKYSFGLMTGFMFARSSSAPRVKVDEGVFAHDPLDRQLTMVTFNGAFKAYDADAFAISSDERSRWFVGAVITPTFGVAVGYSWLPVRGLGINIGYAVLGISAAKGDQKVGDAPTEENDPFRLAAAGTAFLGLSYNFK